MFFFYIFAFGPFHILSKPTLLSGCITQNENGHLLTFMSLQTFPKSQFFHAVARDQHFVVENSNRLINEQTFLVSSVFSKI